MNNYDFRRKKETKKIRLMPAAVLLLSVLAGCAGTGNKAENQAVTAGTETSETKAEELHHAEITVANYGTIRLELNATKAPITVANFMKLAKAGFYDGLTFHRIMDGFMIQGGDPKGNGTGGADERIRGEFKANGVENDISHVKGVISMARAKDYNSASSQFFIMVADYTSLDGLYAAFGHVTEGIRNRGEDREGCEACG